MAISPKACGAVILAGGASKRMGQCKALLQVDGQTMLERTQALLGDFDEILLSTNDPALGSDLLQVADIWPDSGPLAGLHAALCRTEKRALLCLPCDLPHLSLAVPKLLLDTMPEEVAVFICRDSTGRLHPLCGIYCTSVLPVLEDCLRRGVHRVMDFVTQLPYACADTSGIVPDKVFFNMNTPEDYRLAVLEGR